MKLLGITSILTYKIVHGTSLAKLVITSSLFVWNITLAMTSYYVTSHLPYIVSIYA